VKLHFTEEQSDLANAEWGANCGPHSLAAALALDLETARRFMPEFAGKGYTNPTMMAAALARVGVTPVITKGLKTRDLCEGISRIQWEGPWLKPGVPAGAAYYHTHWVASACDMVLCTCTAIAWLPAITWRQHLTGVCATISRCTGWHITHHYAFEVLAKEAA
jgi:hypothetical protein